MYLRNFRICLWHSLRSGVLSSLKQMGWHFLYLFLSFEQKLIHLPSVYWLTDWLICPHNAPANLGWQIILWPNSYKGSGSNSPGQRSLEATTWEFIRSIFGWQQSQQVKNHQPFYIDLCANLVKITYYVDEKKNCTRSLAEA